MNRPKISEIWALLGTSCVAGVILAILAPLGTHETGIVPRFMFWTGLCAAGSIGTGLANMLLRTQSRTFGYWQRVIFQSIGATLMVWMCFFALTLYLYGKPPASFFYTVPFYIWVISIVICGIGELMRHKKRPEMMPATVPAPTRPAIIERLKPALRNADIYALSAEDHYVRVHTSAGEGLILIRLADAINETAPLKGMQTHRSWWAAEAGVKQARAVDGKIILTLPDNTQVPVSRSHMKAVRAAGWI